MYLHWEFFFQSVQIKKGGKPLNPFSGYLIQPSSFIPQMTGFTGIVNYYVNELFFFLGARNVKETDNEIQV